MCSRHFSLVLQFASGLGDHYNSFIPHRESNAGFRISTLLCLTKYSLFPCTVIHLYITFFLIHAVPSEISFRLCTSKSTFQTIPQMLPPSWHFFKLTKLSKYFLLWIIEQFFHPSLVELITLYYILFMDIFFLLEIMFLDKKDGCLWIYCSASYSALHIGRHLTIG